MNQFQAEKLADGDVTLTGRHLGNFTHPMRRVRASVRKVYIEITVQFAVGFAFDISSSRHSPAHAMHCY